MPVARIISSSFEDALKFAEYLRPVFDTVEIASPGRSNPTAVDLEVNLELCTPQQAWQQVEQFGKQADSEIFVAPDTLVSAEVSASQEFAQMAEAGDCPPAAEAMQQEFDAAAQGVDAAIQQASDAAVKAAGSNGSGMHAASPAAEPEERITWLSRTRESLRQWMAVRGLLREIRHLERQRQMALEFERRRRENEAREAALARAAEQKEERLRLQQQALLERQQAEEEELRRQAEQEENIRRGLFVEEILRRRAQEQDAPAPLEPAAVPLEFEAVPAESFAAAADPAPPVRLSGWQGANRWKTATALAGITSMLLLAALVGYAHRRPASPVPLSVLQRSNAVEQKLPFGPAVLPAPEPSSSPVMETPAESSPAEAAPVPQGRDFGRDFRRVRVDSHEVDYVGGDVTVRHFTYPAKHRRHSVTHPAEPIPVTASSRGVKQISDME